MSDIFSQSALQHVVHATLEDAYAAIPEGHTTAVIVDGDYKREEGASIEGELVHRDKDGNWGFAAGGGYNKKEGAHAGFKVAWSK